MMDKEINQIIIISMIIKYYNRESQGIGSLYREIIHMKEHEESEKLHEGQSGWDTEN